MDKYTAFNLYRSGWTTQGTAVAVPLEPDGERREVYLAADVHALLEGLAARLDGEIAVAYNDYAGGQRAAYEHAAKLLRELMVTCAD